MHILIAVIVLLIGALWVYLWVKHTFVMMILACASLVASLIAFIVTESLSTYKSTRQPAKQ